MSTIIEAPARSKPSSAAVDFSPPNKRIPPVLRTLASLIGRNKPNDAVERIGERISVRRIPCGVARLSDGRQILIDREYRPLWVRLPNGEIEVASGDEDVTAPDMFFDLAADWQRDRPGFLRLRAVLVQWGLVRRRTNGKDDKIEPLPKVAAKEPKQQTDVRSQATDVGGPFVVLDKNLCNYPLARDSRLQCQWRRGNKTGRWLSQLPGNGRIQYQFAAKVDPRCPTAFDVNVLFLILATAQHRDNDHIIFESRSEMLRALQYGCDHRNLHQLGQALELWSQISIRFGQWYDKATHRNLHKLRPPPLKSYPCAERGRVALVIDRTWLDRQWRYYEKVTLPLPREAAAQNAVLCVLVSKPDSKNGDVITTRPRGQRRFCKAIGLNHKLRCLVLEHALIGATDWFERNGGWLAVRKDGGSITVVMTKPKLRRLKSAKPITTSDKPAEPVTLNTPLQRRRIGTQRPIVPRLLDPHERERLIAGVDEDGNRVWLTPEEMQ